jgi:hypothetical protein
MQDAEAVMQIITDENVINAVIRCFSCTSTDVYDRITVNSISINVVSRRLCFKIPMYLF